MFRSGPAFKPLPPGPGSKETSFLHALDPALLENQPPEGSSEEIWEYQETRLDILRQHVSAIVEDIIIQVPVSEQNAQLRSMRALIMSLEIVALELRQLRSEGAAQAQAPSTSSTSGP